MCVKLTIILISMYMCILLRLYCLVLSVAGYALYQISTNLKKKERKKERQKEEKKKIDKNRQTRFV